MLCCVWFCLVRLVGIGFGCGDLVVCVLVVSIYYVFVGLLLCDYGLLLLLEFDIRLLSEIELW